MPGETTRYDGADEYQTISVHPVSIEEVANVSPNLLVHAVEDRAACEGEEEKSADARAQATQTQSLPADLAGHGAGAGEIEDESPAQEGEENTSPDGHSKTSDCVGVRRADTARHPLLKESAFMMGF